MGKKTAIAKKRYTLRPALGHIPTGRYQEVRNRVCEILGLKTPSSWSHLLNGYSPSLGAALEVNKVFAEFGVHWAWTEVAES
jgi:hypothetical protein